MMVRVIMKERCPISPPANPIWPRAYFLPYQTNWILDPAPLKICQKGRQVGLSYADSYDSVRKAVSVTGRDVWVMSRDEAQARQYILYCKRWAKALKYAAQVFSNCITITGSGKPLQAHVIRFASGFSIYALSSDPDAIAGRTGHVKLDEFALHNNQRELYAVAKPVTQWGGTLAIISTHRGVGTTFNHIIRDIQEHGNRMGWSLHTIPIQKAVQDGIVEKINAAKSQPARQSPGEAGTPGPKPETPDQFLARLRRECLDEEQWQQEYCCVPADESSAFISYDMISRCEDPSAWQDLNRILSPSAPNPQPSTYFVGFDVARKTDLSVIDIEEKIGDVLWERHRLEMRGASYATQRAQLYQLLRLPQVKRCCIDATGIGNQLAEEARRQFGWKVEPIVFTAQVKSDLAYPLRAAFEDRALRYRRDEKLISDLRGIRKEITTGGHERFVGETADSHCDRFWAKALALHAASHRVEFGAMVA